MFDIKKYEPLWGTWYVEALIGEGTYGKVYKIWQEKAGITYYSVVKIISIPYGDDAILDMKSAGFSDAALRDYSQILVGNIIKEIKIINDPKGSNAFVNYKDIQVIEKHGEIGWDILLRMDAHTSLFDHSQTTPLSHTEVVRLGLDICQALDQCAQKDTVHLNIKPENIFLSQSGRYLLGDIGIMRQIELTISGLITRAACTYMVPELYNGAPYDEANVDTYALGMLMYCLLNKFRPPFLPDYPRPIMPQDQDEAMRRRVEGEPLPPLKGVSPALNDIVLKACAFDGRDRFDSPADMYMALAALTEQEFRPSHEEAGKSGGIGDQGRYSDLPGNGNGNGDGVGRTAAKTKGTDDLTNAASYLKQTDMSQDDTAAGDPFQEDLLQRAVSAMTMGSHKKWSSKSMAAAIVGILALIGVCGFVFADYILSGDNGSVSTEQAEAEIIYLPGEGTGETRDDAAGADEGGAAGDAEDTEDKGAEEKKESGGSVSETTPPENLELTVHTSQPSAPANSYKYVLDNRGLMDIDLKKMIKNGEIPKNTTELSLKGNSLNCSSDIISGLKTLSNLKRLDLSANSILPGNREALRQALPNCVITF